MPIINVQVRRRKSSNPVAEIVCGNSDYKISFNFDSEWNAYNTKTARFIWNGQYVDVVFTGTVCDVPVITDATLCAVGVYADDLRTTTPAMIACKKSVLCGGGLPVDPVPNVYAQIMALFNRFGQPTDEQVDEAVSKWLDEHPEATTTVQDGAITTEKLADRCVTSDKLAQGAVSMKELDSSVLEVLSAIYGILKNCVYMADVSDQLDDLAARLLSDIIQIENVLIINAAEVTKDSNVLVFV